MKLCPECELNYIEDDEKLCSICDKKIVTFKRRLSYNDADVMFKYDNNMDLFENFYQYLLLRGYKQNSDVGNKTTATSYCHWIKDIFRREQLTGKEFVRNISQIVQKYDKGGAESEYGKKGKSTVINALKRFQEFVIYVKKSIKK